MGVLQCFPTLGTKNDDLDVRIASLPALALKACSQSVPSVAELGDLINEVSGGAIKDDQEVSHGTHDSQIGQLTGLLKVLPVN